ncbi:MAG: STAS domain-containing protein [Planctomycetota bacterium]
MFDKLMRLFSGDQTPAKKAAPRPAPGPTPGAFEQAPRVRPEMASFDLIETALIATIIDDHLWGPDAADLVETVLDELEQRGEGVHVILDLQNVELMDSTALGMMVFLNNRLGMLGGRVAVVNASCGLEEMFKLTQLDRMLPVCRDVMKAVTIVTRTNAA